MLQAPLPTRKFAQNPPPPATTSDMIGALPESTTPATGRDPLSNPPSEETSSSTRNVEALHTLDAVKDISGGWKTPRLATRRRPTLLTMGRENLTSHQNKFDPLSKHANTVLSDDEPILLRSAAVDEDQDHLCKKELLSEDTKKSGKATRTVRVPKAHVWDSDEDRNAPRRRQADVPDVIGEQRETAFLGGTKRSHQKQSNHGTSIKLL